MHMHILMPVNAHSRYCGNVSLQSQEHVAFNIHSGLVHFIGLDIVVLYILPTKRTADSG